ncbi:hypothetical protein [Streptomyces uncialis]|uniref:DUF11 domain-containing protein n=1 Tax=Streptomyces uncialis TaxID=1048205 RepID=A0A1Q4VBJ8_9ACTN|nr:hypothetical protein [Streptomyces uncialis]OKH95109.1 hypothetical protein AB852_13495 [Streptomyces uncialis]
MQRPRRTAAVVTTVLTTVLTGALVAGPAVAGPALATGGTGKAAGGGKAAEVDIPFADLKVEATGPAKVVAGDLVEYVVRVTNLEGEEVSTELEFELPKGSTGITVGSRPVTEHLIPVESFLPGSTRVLRIGARIGAGDGGIKLPASFRIPDQPLLNTYKDTDWRNNHAYVDTVNEKGDPFIGPNAVLGVKGQILATSPQSKVLKQVITIKNTGEHRATEIELEGRVHRLSGKILKIDGVDPARGHHTDIGFRYRLSPLNPGRSRTVIVKTRLTSETGPGPAYGGFYVLGSANGGEHTLDLRK